MGYLDTGTCWPLGGFGFGVKMEAFWGSHLLMIPVVESSLVVQSLGLESPSSEVQAQGWLRLQILKRHPAWKTRSQYSWWRQHSAAQKTQSGLHQSPLIFLGRSLDLFWAACGHLSLRSALFQLVKWSEVKSLSRVLLFATPWTVAHQAPPSMGFSRQEYWSGLPFPSPGDLPNL